MFFLKMYNLLVFYNKSINKNVAFVYENNNNENNGHFS